jgi:hypothetical protein
MKESDCCKEDVKYHTEGVYAGMYTCIVCTAPCQIKYTTDCCRSDILTTDNPKIFKCAKCGSKSNEFF